MDWVVCLLTFTIRFLLFIAFHAGRAHAGDHRASRIEKRSLVSFIGMHKPMIEKALQSAIVSIESM
ncbi:hypothetical protein BJ508DRAFT_59513 [Ascobolus immersus RN42]|uniref:Uncharacterized protein n=1 Tax=Ascobolus immersus RN42 TaxID=1160509 RepID=A0A3N4J0H9_ASCIM|nr:hypothetical protein BJ508DRAFT_59513 [Ascobolus immersus RN42]